MVDSVLIESGDSDAAENVDAMFGHPSLVDTVHPQEQFTVTPDTANDAVDMSAGKAFIGLDTVTTPAGDTRRRAMVTVEKDAVANVALANVNAVNYIYLQADLGTGDSPQWVVNDTGTAPSDDSLLVATVEAHDPDGDGSAESIDGPEYYNRGSELIAEALEHPDDAPIDLRGTDFIDVGHDEVDVPQVRNLTVADFESGTLEDYWNNLTSRFDVQSSTVKEGSYALRCQHQGGNTSINTSTGLGSFPQAGDVIEFYTYLSDPDDQSFTAWAYDSTESTFYQVSIDASAGDFALQKVDQDTNPTLITKNVALSNYLNEWLYVKVEWGKDGVFYIELQDSSGTVLASGDNSGSPDQTYKSGGLRIRANNASSTSSSVYWDSLTAARREPEAAGQTEKGVTEAGNELTPSGGIHTGPAETEVNALRSVLQQAPVTDGATQGDVSLLTLLQSGLDPAVYLERILDGQGGAYAHQLQSALGRLPRVNANLSWEYDSLADVPNWSSADGGASVWTFNVNGRPRRIHVEHDGSAGSDDYGGVLSSVLVSYQSVGGFRVTFHDVSYTNNNDDNSLRLGVTADNDMAIGAGGSNSIFLDDSFAGQTEDRFITPDGNAPPGDVDWTENKDVTIEYDGSEARLYFDGVLQASVATSTYRDYSPFLQIKDDAGNTQAETAEIEQVTVEPLAEVLN